MELHFYGAKGAYGFLSNFSPAPFTFGGVEWNTVEAYFQGQKALAAGDKTRLAAIKGALTPAKAKALGGLVKGLNVPAWNAARRDVMLEGVRAKFEQNAALAAALLATGSARLIEDAPNDTYWGAGRSGQGLNVLGGILQIVRNELRGRHEARATAEEQGVAVEEPPPRAPQT